MLSEADLARIGVSVQEQQLRQRWRLRLLWVLRLLSFVFLMLVLRAALQWPFDNFSDAVERCFREPNTKTVRDCVRDEAESRRAIASGARRDVLALLGLLALTLGVALRTRFDLNRQSREQSRFSDQVFDAVPLPLSLRTPGGMFLRVNAAFEKWHGTSHQELVGRHHSAFFPAWVVEKIEGLDRQALASREPIAVEMDLSATDRPQHVILHLQAVRAEDGAALGIVIVREDITVLRAHQAGLVASNERLRRLSAQMLDAQEEERRRIARELHDQVGQVLTAIQLQLGSVAKRGAVDDAASALRLAREFADEALRHTRDLSASLHPHLLDDLGLEPALHWLTDRFIRPLVPTVELRCRLEPPRGPQDIELVAFRVVQEALTNAARHARATRIGVILETGDGRLSIEVIDDGVGFDASSEAGTGASLGLTSMNERVAEFGGELSMDSTPGIGTRLRANLPWTAKQEQQ